jgi:uncharacterized membrane protein
LAVSRAFPAAALKRIEQAIDAAERGHSGEIRFAVESSLPWSYLKRDAPARERALMVFAKLRVWDTENNNGVLIYVELADHSIEIVADRGIARHVAPAEWQQLAAQMRDRFRSGEFEGGRDRGRHAGGAATARAFPAGPSAPESGRTNQPAGGALTDPVGACGELQHWTSGAVGRPAAQWPFGRTEPSRNGAIQRVPFA